MRGSGCVVARARTEEMQVRQVETEADCVWQAGDVVEIRYNFNTLSHRYRETSHFFGTVFCTLDISGDSPVITRKKVVLNNDYINQVIDVYHL